MTTHQIVKTINTRTAAAVPNHPIRIKVKKKFPANLIFQSNFEKRNFEKKNKKI